MDRVADARTGPGEVRIRVRCCAVCRTDLHVVEGDLVQEKMPVIPGHQIVGIVDKLGPPLAVSQPEREGGTTATPTRPAGGRGLAASYMRHVRLLHPRTRKPLRVGPFHRLSRRRRIRRVRRGAGGDFVYRLPEAFSDIDAAPLLCSGIIGYRALRRCNLRPGGKLALYGFGSSAHVVIQIALHRGCEVYVVTRGENHRELARQMGAVWVGEDARQMPVKVDSAIMFAPAGELVLPALESLQKGGTLSLAGIYMTPIPQMDYMRYVFYERDIHSVTCNTPQRRPPTAGRGRRHPHPPTHHPVSAGRREPGAPGPEKRPDQRDGSARD